MARLPVSGVIMAVFIYFFHPCHEAQGVIWPITGVNRAVTQSIFSPDNDTYNTYNCVLAQRRSIGILNVISKLKEIEFCNNYMQIEVYHAPCYH